MSRNLLLALLTLTAPVAAEGILLDWPVDCQLGEDCHIQQFTDHDPGPGAVDFTCGSLSYDGHKGTDIALPSLAAMARGVTVRAAAPGVVVGLRDGMEDRILDADRAAEIDGRDCGNGVLLRHAEGWETQYCHLKQGSLRVTKGQEVAAGTPLGAIGLSGRSQFPHLHLSLRHAGKVVDPFAPAADVTAPGSCAPSGEAGAELSVPAATLWRHPPAYAATGLIALGFASTIPDYAAIKAGTADESPLPRGSAALVLWAYGWGGQAGDELRFSLTTPEGAVLLETRQSLEKAQAQYFRAAGRRLSAELDPGDYIGTVTLWRAGQMLDQARKRMTLP